MIRRLRLARAQPLERGRGLNIKFYQVVNDSINRAHLIKTLDTKAQRSFQTGANADVLGECCTLTPRAWPWKLWIRMLLDPFLCVSF